MGIAKHTAIWSDLEFHTCDIHVKVDCRSIDNFWSQMTFSRVDSPLTNVFGIILRYAYGHPRFAFLYLLNCFLCSVVLMLQGVQCRFIHANYKLICYATHQRVYMQSHEFNWKSFVNSVTGSSSWGECSNDIHCLYVMYTSTYH